ncbi:hypothetical protein [Pacificoceanicola onchidii]|uniref:hypothetical protein n=1 Tax=Pacificoceanicola onchidii TaxID=2562685 RepID=UPI0010A5F67D|nr:hypothetical protein [Pacificoceanicola onchidii]
MPSIVSHALIAAAAFALGRWSAGLRWRSTALAPSAGEPGALGSFETPQGRASETEKHGRIPMTGERLFMLIFLLGWIFAWSVACLTALRFVLSGQGGLFLIGWLIAALAGWGLAANTIYRLVTGKPVRGRGGRDI